MHSSTCLQGGCHSSSYFNGGDGSGGGGCGGSSGGRCGYLKRGGPLLVDNVFLAVLRIGLGFVGFMQRLTAMPDTTTLACFLMYLENALETHGRAINACFAH